MGAVNHANRKLNSIDSVKQTACKPISLHVYTCRVCCHFFVSCLRCLDKTKPIRIPFKSNVIRYNTPRMIMINSTRAPFPTRIHSYEFVSSPHSIHTHPASLCDSYVYQCVIYIKRTAKRKTSTYQPPPPLYECVYIVLKFLKKKKNKIRRKKARHSVV